MKNLTKSYGKIICLSTCFILPFSACGKKKKDTPAETQTEFSDLLAINLQSSLTQQGFTATEAKKIADAASAKSKTNASTLYLSAEGTGLKNKAAGFAQGAVAAIDEAGITDETKKQKLIQVIASVIGDGLNSKKTFLTEDLKTLPSVVASAVVLGLKDSGTTAENLSALLSEATKNTMTLINTLGVSTNDRDDAAREIVASSITKLDDLNLGTGIIGEFSADLLAGAIDGIPDGSQLAELKTYMNEMSTGVPDAVKSAGLTDGELTEALKAASMKAMQALASATGDTTLWDDLSNEFGQGLVKGLDGDTVSEEYLDDALRDITEGLIEGVATYKEQLQSQALVELIASAAGGASEGLADLGLENSKIETYLEDINLGVSEGLDDSSLPDSVKDSAESSVADSTTGALSAKLTEAERTLLKSKQVFLAKLASEWTGTCVLSSISGAYAKRYTEIDDGYFVSKTTFYSTNSCEESTRLAIVTARGDFSIGAKDETQTDTFDVVIPSQKIFITPFAESFVTFLNNTPYGDSSGKFSYNYPAGTFRIDTETEVTGRKRVTSENPEPTSKTLKLKIDGNTLCDAGGGTGCLTKIPASPSSPSL